MPSDIRSFFGGKPASSAETPPPEPKKTTTKRGRGSRKVVDDDSDEEAVAPKPKKSTPVKSVKRALSPQGEATTSSEYFGKGKPKRSEPVRAAAEEKTNGWAKTPTKVNGGSRNGITYETPEKRSKRGTPNSRTSTRSKAQKSYAEDFDDGDFPDDLEVEEAANMPKATPASKKATDGTAKSTPASTRSKRVKKQDVDYDEDKDVKMEGADDDNFVVPDDEDEPKSKKPNGRSSGTKRKAKDLGGEDEETPAKKSRQSTGATSKKKKEEVQDSAEVASILAGITTIRPPTPPPKDSDGKYKFNFGQNNNQATPAAAGSKEMPQGAENCLAGRSFVFTGVLATLEREKGQALVKQYGGKVMGAPSKKTDFVVLGTDAGPKKLQTIRENNLKVIDEDGLFELIRKLPANGGDSKAGAAFAEKKAKEDKKMREEAAEMERQAAEEAKAQKAKGKVIPVTDSQLWTVKYAPSTLSHIVGNKTVVEKLQRWLREFPRMLKTKFKLPGKDGSGTFRAVIMHGPPGIGKTTAAHLVAKLEGYDIVESNASDTRSKKLVETGLKGVLDTTSLHGYFAADGNTIEASKRKLCLIMDEVDGMSAGDRGGVGAMAAVIKKTQIPIILICNERRQPKMRPFDYVAYELAFRRPTTEQIASRMRTITHREKLNMPSNVLSALIEGTGADLRQTVNMLSTAKLDEADMNFQDGKNMSKAWEKHVVLKPWDINGKILGGNMFGTSSTKTLNDKSELYFNDHELSYLMLQENYLGTTPHRASTFGDEKLRRLKTIQLASSAADSISDGDLVDRMIHGSQQQWSLMPVHSIFSFVRPASYVYGNLGYSQRAGFPRWLGQNSAQGKLTRFVKEIQGHMRLRMTGDRHDVRQQYMPLLWKELVERLQKEGKEAIDEIISLMDSYFLTKDDFDAIMELGVGPYDSEKVKIESTDKAAFTREYNKREHPLPFIKASTIGAPKKLSKDKPDLEEAIDESDDNEVLDTKEDDDEDEDLDLSKDKYVKQPKKKKVPAAGKGKGGKKAKAAAGDDDDLDEEDGPPKKGKGKATAKSRGKK